METDEKRSTGKKRGKLLAGLLKCALLAAGFFTYLLAGAMVFQMLEQESESNVKEETERHRLDFLKNYTCLTQDAVERLIKVVTEAVKQGINPLGNPENSTPIHHTNWDFGSAFFFSGTVVTTIGYGTIAPRTPGGQMFCVVYALFGIPFNIIVLSQIGKNLSLWCKLFAKFWAKKGIKKKTAKVLTIIFFLVMGIIVFLAIPPLVFITTESWSYEEGLYYAFITLSTIGFGDFVVGSGQRRKKPFDGFRALVCFWIIFGLAWLSLLINLLISLLEDTEKKILKDLRKKVKQRKERSQGNALQELVQKPEPKHETSVI
ncbi:potassium channel subfamily K member 16-like [Rana temporaria]|uniref:potassium channel subfamily K member 16-like n=1 Tax=Rana temporaria TaxID=8407 RepID=UPI001AACB25F|nr:potassium channel subfamily K member 16-like [Rana temporaria]XP_040189809.1 potassium channel subfamily K member 16-like [Rana temporaria]